MPTPQNPRKSFFRLFFFFTAGLFLLPASVQAEPPESEEAVSSPTITLIVNGHEVAFPLQDGAVSGQLTVEDSYDGIVLLFDTPERPGEPATRSVWIEGVGWRNGSQGFFCSECREALDLLEEHVPPLHAWLMDIQRKSPEEFAIALARARPHLRHLVHLEAHDPDRYQFERHRMQAAYEVQMVYQSFCAGVQASDEAAIAHATGPLRKALTERFDAETMCQELKIEDLKARLDALTVALIEHRSSRAQRIESHIECLRKKAESGGSCSEGLGGDSGKVAPKSDAPCVVR